MKSAPNRRDFLKATGLLGLSAAMPACTALDRVLMGQNADHSDRVVILGGGMAGLAAAFELRKRGLPYRLFEGASRIGGRAYSLASLTPTGQGGELGAEWFSAEDRLFWELGKELKLEIVEVKQQQSRLFLNRESGLAQIPVADLRKLRQIARNSEGLPADRGALARSLDKWKNQDDQRPVLSIAEWGSRFSDDSAWKDLLNAWSLFRYGMPSEQLRAGSFAHTFLFADNVLDAWAGNRYRFRGDSSSLANALLDRVIGAIPGDRVRLQSKLIRIEKLNQGYELAFETSEGRRRIKALNVICTLPWATLQRVEGIEEFEIAAALKSPVISHQAKAVLSFPQRFWKSRWDQGRLLGPESIWEASYRVQEWLPNEWGVLTSQWSGAKAEAAGPHLFTDFTTRLQTLEKNIIPVPLESYVHNWTTSPWIGGRGTYPDLKKAAAVFEKNQDTWHWAGEHAAGDQVGTWAGALESGRRVARLIEMRNS